MTPALLYLLFGLLCVIDCLCFHEIATQRVRRDGYDAWVRSGDRSIAFVQFGAVFIYVRAKLTPNAQAHGRPE